MATERELKDILKQINDVRRELNMKAVKLADIGNLQQALKEL